MRRFVSWFKALSVAGKTGVLLATFIGIGVVGAAGQNPSETQTKLTTPSSKASEPKVITKTVTSTKPIPYTTSTNQDGTLAKGTTKVTTMGVDGVETLTYQDTYSNGTQTAHKLTSDVVTIQPVTQVTSLGTYVAAAPSTMCTNGSYVNSAGNTVCSPESSPSAPSGATAQCADGTYSFSQSHSGTCSHHGGVATWL
ncbi:MAG TPA: DUF3761 domain-containing protein [Candidatus Saccharimonadales bacterium]|nr:DUF3761 domain-containing protein [Candidatus Saccharimonadales bacterium]